MRTNLVSVGSLSVCDSRCASLFLVNAFLAWSTCTQPRTLQVSLPSPCESNARFSTPPWLARTPACGGLSATIAPLFSSSFSLARLLVTWFRQRVTFSFACVCPAPLPHACCLVCNSGPICTHVLLRWHATCVYLGPNNIRCSGRCTRWLWPS